MPIPTPLGDRVRQARERAGLDQAAVAEALGVHAKTVSKWENDHQAPNDDMLASLAKVLNTEPAMLAYGVNQEAMSKAWEREQRQALPAWMRSLEAARSAKGGGPRMSALARLDHPRPQLPNKVLAHVHRFVAELAEHGATEDQLEAARMLMTSYDTWAFLAGDNLDTLGEADWLALVRRMVDGLRVAAGLPRTVSAE